MVCHWVRRDSSGWVDDGWFGVLRLAVWWESRRVSGRPGAEGAPREIGSEMLVLVLDFVVGLEWEGTMRRD